MQILRFICIFSEKSFELCFEPVLKTLSRDHYPLLSVSHLLTSHPCEDDLTSVPLAKDDGY